MTEVNEENYNMDIVEQLRALPPELHWAGTTLVFLQKFADGGIDAEEMKTYSAKMIETAPLTVLMAAITAALAVKK